MHPTSLSELNAALLQAVITLGIAALCAFLFVQFRKRYFLWWAIAWGLYVLRIGAICGFLTTAHEPWLYAQCAWQLGRVAQQARRHYPLGAELGERLSESRRVQNAIAGMRYVRRGLAAHRSARF